MLMWCRSDAGVMPEQCRCGAGAVLVRCRVEDQQREHKSAKIPPGSWGDEASGCTGVHWCALAQCGPHGCSALWARHPLPHCGATGVPTVTEHRWDLQGKHGAAWAASIAGALHQQPPSHVIWWDTAEIRVCVCVCGYVLHPKTPGCPPPPGPCGADFSISKPGMLLEFTVQKPPWQSLGGYF